MTPVTIRAESPAPLAAPDLLNRLRRHYIDPSRRLPGGVFVSEVGLNGGYGAGSRCDAIYVGFTSASGRQLIGHEVKVSRSDWLTEISSRKTGKADAWADQCHQFWLVVSDPAIVHDGELPPGWGVMSPGRSRSRMTIHHAAATKTEHTPSWNVVRSVFSRYDTLRADELTAGYDAELARARQKANEEAEKTVAYRIAQLPDVTELQERIVAIEQALGARIDWTSESKPPREGTVGLAALREIAALVRAQGDLHRIAQRITVGYANPVSAAEKAIKDLHAALDGIAAAPGTGLSHEPQQLQPGGLRAS